MCHILAKQTSHGVIQGYTGVATVDAKHQVVVHAEAQEHGLLEPSIEQAHQNLRASDKDKQTVKITADSGYHNEKALEYLEDQHIDGYIADTGFRSRDPRFKDYKQHKPKERLTPKRRFTVDDFTVDIKKQTCTCPAGKPMWLKNQQSRIGHQFQAYEHDCPVCPLKTQCLKHTDQNPGR